MNPSDADRRAHPRLSLPAIVRIYGEGSKVASYLVRNVSAGGALVSGRAELGPGTAVVLEIDFVSEGEEIEVTGRVLRCEIDVEGFVLAAIAFDSLSERCQAIVQRLADQTGRSGDKSVVLVDSRLPHLRVLAQRVCRTAPLRVHLARTPLEVVRWLHGNPDVAAVLVSRVGDELWALQVLSIVFDDFPRVRRVLVAPRSEMEAAGALLLSGTAQAVLADTFSHAELAEALDG